MTSEHYWLKAGPLAIERDVTSREWTWMDSGYHGTRIPFRMSCQGNSDGWNHWNFGFLFVCLFDVYKTVHIRLILVDQDWLRGG